MPQSVRFNVASLIRSAIVETIPCGNTILRVGKEEAMGLIDTIKEAAEMAQQLGQIELRSKILDLQTAALEEREERLRLVGQIEQLQKVLDVSDRLSFSDNRYWMENDDGTKDGPFCTRCWDVDRNLVRLHTTGSITSCPDRNCPTKLVH